MYHFRLKILIILCVGGMVIAIGRLLTLQTFQVQKARQELADMRKRRPQQRPTVRGNILDRYGNPLAIDKPAFFLHINYQLTRYRDPRWREGKILRQLAVQEDKTKEQVEQELYQDKWQQSLKDLEHSINLAWQLADVSREEIEENINRINDQIWERSRFIWWKRRNSEKSWSQYLDERDGIRIQDIVTVSLAEMNDTYPLVELKTPQDLQRAQVELLGLEHLKIKSESKRRYPYESAACHLIGWVAPWQDSEAEIFKDDAYMSYEPGEIVGKWGLEKAYEPVLRGRRGAVRYDIEGNLLERIKPRYGRDVRLTIDIDLQQKVERLLAESTNKYCAAVVLEVANNDILAMVSMPTFDLNTIRKKENYGYFFNRNDPNKLWQHKALERNYPPGSTAKPLIFVAGLEENKISPNEIISCGYQPPPSSWPKCIAQWKFRNPHDNKWANNGRNAIRGSCNVYFSRLANRLDARDLQKWLFDFGYGRNILPAPMPDDISEAEATGRHIRQAAGNIIFGRQKSGYTEFEDVPTLKKSQMFEKRYWGIGQGNLRATVLQVANGLSAIARGGVYKEPRVIDSAGDFINEAKERRLGLSQRTLDTVRDGMWAVANETSGTAYRVFGPSPLRTERNIKIYGKTGSTQNPSMAWFECFAEEPSGRAVVIVVLVEGGLSGSGEAAPLGEKVLDLCNRAGYIGTVPTE